ncbi:restriction endonuclease subunit S, partial [Micrococcus sp. SIMBA_144]
EKRISNTPYITLSTLSEMTISVPSREEQIKILNLFKSFDKIIQLEASNLSKLYDMRQGLLNNLFV